MSTNDATTEQLLLTAAGQMDREACELTLAHASETR